MTTHTLGPWTLTHVAGNNFAIQTFEVRGMFGDSPNVYPIFNRSAEAIDGGYIHTSPENARLIAAAPELLEALELFVSGDWWGKPAVARKARASAHAAIAKARGQALASEAICDSGSDPTGEDPKGLSAPASQSGPKGIAQNRPPEP